MVEQRRRYQLYHVRARAVIGIPGGILTTKHTGPVDGIAYIFETDGGDSVPSILTTLAEDIKHRFAGLSVILQYFPLMTVYCRSKKMAFGAILGRITANSSSCQLSQILPPQSLAIPREIFFVCGL
jgi:hypothetical protein